MRKVKGTLVESPD